MDNGVKMKYTPAAFAEPVKLEWAEKINKIQD